MSEATVLAPPQEARRNLPPLPAEVSDLGEIIGVFTPGKVAPWLCYVVATGYLIIAGGLWGFAQSLAPAAVERVPLLIVAGVLGLVGLACCVMGLLAENFPKLLGLRTYVLSSYGLVYSRRDQTHIVAWEELDIRKTCANPFNSRHEISGRGADPFVLKPYLISRKLRRALLEAQVRFECPRMIEAIQGGETIQFGRLGVCAAGLVDGGDIVRWGRIEALNFSYDQKKTQQLFLTVQAHGHEPLSFNASKELPNLWLFMELVSQIHPPLEQAKNSQAWWLK
jgi:hypothetical protein